MPNEVIRLCTPPATLSFWTWGVLPNECSPYECSPNEVLPPAKPQLLDVGSTAVRFEKPRMPVTQVTA